MIIIYTGNRETLFEIFSSFLSSVMESSRVGLNIFLHVKVWHNAERNTKRINLEEITQKKCGPVR